MSPAPGVYVGTIRHRRFAPRPHEFRYALAMVRHFFGACDRLLDRDGLMLLQTITVDDWRFREYRSAPSWIAKYIFPGAELASVAAILASLARVSRMGLYHAEQIGPHYARTLHHWRQRFHRRLDDVRAQGFDDRFIRMWDLYFGSARRPSWSGTSATCSSCWPGRPHAVCSPASCRPPTVHRSPTTS